MKDYEKLASPNIGTSLQKVRDDLKFINRSAESYVQNTTSFDTVQFERDFIKDNPLFVQRKRKNKGEFKPGDEASGYDFSQFIKKFPILKEAHPCEDAISSVFVLYINKLLQEERIGSALNYQDTYYSLKKFSGNVRLCEITPSYLIRYEKWMLNRGRSKSTVGIKLRPLRAIFNFAIDGLAVIKKDLYSFGRYKYLIPTSKNTKKSLEMDVVGKMFYYQPQCDEERRARDFWFFLYFGNGMNPKDMAF